MSGVAQTDYDLGINRALQVTRHLVGAEREPIIVIDDVLRQPQALVEYAAREVPFAPAWHDAGGYPGLRAPAPLNYVEALVRALAPIIAKAYSLQHVSLARAECNLSIVTLAPDQLVAAQRVPHIDTVDPLQFAVLHYLCDESFGGTAFYRHRATGCENVTPERQGDFDIVRARELAIEPPGPGYIAGDTQHYRQTAAIDARLNRVVVYRSRLLHSGQIATNRPLPADPRRGRLTANIFVNYRTANA